jgi:hypothetical protein
MRALPERHQEGDAMNRQTEDSALQHRGATLKRVATETWEATLRESFAAFKKLAAGRQMEELLVSPEVANHTGTTVEKPEGVSELRPGCWLRHYRPDDYWWSTPNGSIFMPGGGLRGGIRTREQGTPTGNVDLWCKVADSDSDALDEDLRCRQVAARVDMALVQVPSGMRLSAYVPLSVGGFSWFAGGWGAMNLRVRLHITGGSEETLPGTYQHSDASSSVFGEPAGGGPPVRRVNDTVVLGTSVLSAESEDLFLVSVTAELLVCVATGRPTDVWSKFWADAYYQGIRVPQLALYMCRPLYVQRD